MNKKKIIFQNGLYKKMENILFQMNIGNKEKHRNIKQIVLIFFE